MAEKKIKARKLWNINPKTKIRKSRKKYNRKKKKKDLNDFLEEVL